jgi:DNA sulfur modification protein DndC
MPPPSSSLRWCTDKLKVMPIDSTLKSIFSDGAFISIIGTRSDESTDRANRMERATLKGTNLKLNNRYPKASNLMPIEDWSTKDVWEYLLKQNNDLVNIDFLWKLYSDASNKDASECTFTGAGGKHIEEGKLGCGTSRFGCWQCYMVRDKDKSLDGLMQSGHENIELYKSYRDWFWERTQQGWEKTRDVYSHNHQMQNFYNKGGEENPKYGMTVPRGLTLKLRKEGFKKLLELQSNLDEIIITEAEIIEIQKRWLIEGDLNLSAFKIARKYNYQLNHFNLPREFKKNKQLANTFYKQYLLHKNISQHFTVLTRKRFAIQYILNSEKVKNKFFASKLEEKHIRKEWKSQKPIKVNHQIINLLGSIQY